MPIAVRLLARGALGNLFAAVHPDFLREVPAALTVVEEFPCRSERAVVPLAGP